MPGAASSDTKRAPGKGSCEGGRETGIEDSTQGGSRQAWGKLGSHGDQAQARLPGGRADTDDSGEGPSPVDSPGPAPEASCEGKDRQQ